MSRGNLLSASKVRSDCDVAKWFQVSVLEAGAFLENSHFTLHQGAGRGALEQSNVKGFNL